MLLHLEPCFSQKSRQKLNLSNSFNFEAAKSSYSPIFSFLKQITIIYLLTIHPVVANGLHAETLEKI